MRNSPSLVSLYVDNILRSVSAELHTEGLASDKEGDPEDQFPALPASFTQQLESSSFMFLLTLLYTVQLAERRSSKGLLQVLPCLAVATPDFDVAASIPPTLWHLLTGRLAQLPVSVLSTCSTTNGQVPLLTLVFERLLMPLAKEHDICLGHSLRTLAIIRPGLEGALLSDGRAWLSNLQPQNTVRNPFDHAASSLLSGGTTLSLSLSLSLSPPPPPPPLSLSLVSV